MQEMNSETSRNQEDMQENPESYANKINQNQEEESKDSTIINQQIALNSKNVDNDFKDG